MKQVFDVDAILFNILKQAPVKNAINGNIYTGDDRPQDSHDEDIVINNIVLSQDYHPQIGTSNVNIYVPDMNVNINGKQQIVSNRKRLKEISTLTIDALKNAKVDGLIFTIDTQNFLQEKEVKQHYVNLRISWNIQID